MSQSGICYCEFGGQPAHSIALGGRPSGWSRYAGSRTLQDVILVLTGEDWFAASDEADIVHDDDLLPSVVCCGECTCRLRCRFGPHSVLAKVFMQRLIPPTSKPSALYRITSWQAYLQDFHTPNTMTGGCGRAWPCDSFRHMKKNYGSSQ